MRNWCIQTEPITGFYDGAVHTPHGSSFGDKMEASIMRLFLPTHRSYAGHVTQANGGSDSMQLFVRERAPQMSPGKTVDVPHLCLAMIFPTSPNDFGLDVLVKPS